jgi:hypothetical protein
VSKEYNKYVEFAKHGTLPADFDQWGLTDENGWTVAHTAAWEGGLLPAGFEQWSLAGKEGWTVAHVAAMNDILPADFDQWGLADDKERTVLRQLLLSSTRLDKYVARWGKEKPLCKTEVDWRIFKKELPEIYQKYSISECMLDADDQEALQGALL